MEIAVSQKGRFTILALSGRLDALAAPEFESAAGRLVDEGARAVILDLADLVFVSSAGLRGFLSLAKTLRGVQGEIRFSGLQEAVAEVFTISGFPKMFAIHPSLEAATDDPAAQ